MSKPSVRIASTNETVTIVGPPTRSGKVLVQRESNGTIDVVNTKDLKVVKSDRQDSAR